MDLTIDPVTDLVSGLYLLWGKPAPHAMILEIGVQTASEHVIIARITDEASVVENRVHHRSTPEVNPFVGHTSSTKKVKGAAVLGEMDGMQLDN